MGRKTDRRGGAARMSTYHRRELPKSCTSFSSARGRELFARALAQGSLEPYWRLAEQFHTQAEPAYCGLATLVMVLNAMAIDPQRVWKGVWRWFDENLVNCSCKDIEVVKTSGISLAEFAQVARCNGVNCEVVRGTEMTADEFRSRVKRNMRRQADQREPCCSYLAVNYDRGRLGQTGTGHFSPIAGYDEETDSVLIMDVARFKYPPHWVSLPLLHSAMVEGGRGMALLWPGVHGETGLPALGCTLGSCVLAGFDEEGKSLRDFEDQGEEVHTASCARCSSDK